MSNVEWLYSILPIKETKITKVVVEPQNK